MDKRLVAASLVVLFAVALVLTGTCAMGQTVSGWTARRTYTGHSHTIDWRTVDGGGTPVPIPIGDPPIDTVRPWPDEMGPVTYSNNGRQALASTAGRMTINFVWEGAGTPPETMWIREEATASWQVGGPGGGNVVGYAGWATCSIGGDYQEGHVEGGLPDWRQGKCECIRDVKVDSSSGHFAIEVSFFAGARGTVDGDGTGRLVKTGCSLSVTSGGLPFTTINTNPPGRDASPSDHPVGDDPVNLATGAQSLLLAPDIVSYNPYGPSPEYTRSYYNTRAKAGHAALGLSPGWVDNYDVTVTPLSPGTWGALESTYPNGAKESISPVLDGNQPTGAFSTPVGAPYLAEGELSSTVGRWESIKITFGDQSQWVLTSSNGITYRLTNIINRMGRRISIVRDVRNGGRITSIKDDSTPVPRSLLTFAYSGGYLSSVTDAYGRKVTYTYGVAAGSTCLLSVSGIVPSHTPNAAARTTYGYSAIGTPACALLTSVTDPNPTGSGTKTDRINYYTDSSDLFSCGKIASLVDDHGNKHEYVYESDQATRVRVKNPAGTVEAEWVASYDPAHGGRQTGSSDTNNRYTSVGYTDPDNPSKPTVATDKTGKQTKTTYDKYGNVLTVTDPRGTETKFLYEYEHSALGRVISVQQGTRTPTTFTYHETSGLVESVESPKPGATDGSTVKTWFTYDALGNVNTIKRPGNNAAATVTTVYDYGLQPKLGQPLWVAEVADPTNPSDPGWSRKTYLSYDARGNLLSATDAEGHRVDYTYNIANQPLLTILPATP